MSVAPDYLRAGTAPSYWGAAVARSMVSTVGVLADALVIIAISVLTGAIYHEVAYGDLGPFSNFIEVGGAAAGLFVLPSIIRGEYSLFNYFYARRHNVKPGITGWAQVSGLRGETDTDDKMQRRVDHDLFYIDNWSLLFDLRILLQTVFSREVHRNAT